MPKIKTQNNTDLGLERIEEIKSSICSSKPQTCKAEVYETWDNVFLPEE